MENLFLDGDQVTPVASITPAEFKEIYKDFGYEEALATDPGSLSYVVEPVKGLRNFGNKSKERQAEIS